MCYFIVTNEQIEKEENEYERLRLINMKRNYEKMLQLGLVVDMKTSLSSIPAAAPRATAELSCSDESSSDSDSEDFVDSDSDSDSDSEKMCYSTVSSYEEALQLTSSSKSTAFNTPVPEYWNYVDRTFVDKENEQLYAVDFVVRSSQGLYFFEYVAINDKGEAEENAEELYSTCFEMIAEDSWAEWKDYKKN